MVNSVGQVGIPPIQANSLGYTGSPLNYVPIVTASRDPTGLDVNYATGCEWTNGITLDLWKLFGFTNGVAIWRMAASGGGGGGIQSLSDDFGSKAFPDGTGDVQQFGSPGIKTLAGATSITFSLVGDGVAGQYYNVDQATGTGVNPVVPDAGGNLNLTGAQVGPLGVGVEVVQTHTYSPNSITWEIQQTDTAVSKDTSKNGVSHFNDAQFTADEGFISLIGGGGGPAFAGVDVDAHTAPGTDPVVADGTGLITVTGDQVAAGIIGATVIRTDSIAANTITVEIQRSFATAAPDLTANGVSHFDSAFFSVDSDGFVQLATSTSGVTEVTVDSFTPPGTNPVVPDISGNMNVSGQIVSAGTVPVQTNSLAINTYDIQVQTTQAVVSTDATRNGLAHFKDADFIVDPNGFVALANPPPNWPPFGPTLKDMPQIVIEDFCPSISSYFAGFATETVGQFNRIYNGSSWVPTSYLGHPGYVNCFRLGTGAGALSNITWNTGASQNFSTGNYGSIEFGSSNLQLDMIAKYYSGTAAQIGFIIPVASSNFSAAYFAVGVYSGNTYFSVTLYNGSYTTQNTGVLYDTDWHRYTITYDPVTQLLVFYIDDVLTNTFTTGMGIGAFGVTSSYSDYQLLVDLMVFRRVPSVPRY